MIYRRRALAALVLLCVAVLSAVARIAAGGAEPSPARAPARHAPEPSLTAGPAAAVVRSLNAVERAFNAGDVSLLCRPGALVDPAVIREQSTEPGGCTSDVEALMSNRAPLHLTVRSVALKPDLATAVVTAGDGAAVSVDLIRHGSAWLLSFSDGDDPMPSLAGG